MDNGETTSKIENNPKRESDFSIKLSPKVLVVVLLIVILAAAAFYNKDKFMAATVDGSVVTRLEVIQMLERQNGESVLNTLIEEKLISNEARKQNIDATTQEIDEKLAALKTQIESQGGTLDTALQQANMSVEDLRRQISIQMKLEKLLGDKLNVTEEEITSYIEENQITVPADQPDFESQIGEQIKSEKFGASVNVYLDELKSNAKINTYVNY